MWSRYTLAQIEVEHHVPTASQTLRALATDAAAHHYRLLARQTATLAHKLRAR